MLSFPLKMEETFFIKFSRWSRNNTSQAILLHENLFFSILLSISQYLSDYEHIYAQMLQILLVLQL